MAGAPGVDERGGTDGRWLDPPAGIDPLDAAGLHLDPGSADGESTTDGDEQDPDPGYVDRYGQLENLIDAFVEAFNAHDLERSCELLSPDAELPGVGGDADGFAEVVTRCWEERPHAILTRGVLPASERAWDGQPVAVLWDVGDTTGWSRSGLLSFDADGSDALGVIEYVGDPTIIEQADVDDPEPDLPEGAHWREWDEGADPL